MTRSARLMSSEMESLKRKASIERSGQLSGVGRTQPLPTCRTRRSYPQAFSACGRLIRAHRCNHLIYWGSLSVFLFQLTSNKERQEMETLKTWPIRHTRWELSIKSMDWTGQCGYSTSWIDDSFLFSLFSGLYPKRCTVTQMHDVIVLLGGVRLPCSSITSWILYLSIDDMGAGLIMTSWVLLTSGTHLNSVRSRDL